MLVRSLKLSGVRNLAPLELEPGERFNVLSGENGQGKTNLLEALYVLCALRSFRTQRLAELICHGGEQAQLQAVVSRGGLERHHQVTLLPRSRRVRLDGKAVRPISRYFGHFNVVLFAPEDLQIPRGSPSDRRRFLDRAVFNLRPAHLADIQGYDKALRSRNRLLRELAERGRPDAEELLAVYDEQIAVRGARVMCARARLVAEMRPRLRQAFDAITRTGLAADALYRPRVALGDEAEPLPDEAAVAGALRRALGAARAEDRARQVTSRGPHRDDLELLLDGRSAAAFASQGQLRALVLAWKTAELELLAEREPPILLLDDVSSELDATRNEYLFEFLTSRPCQCFITTTHSRHVLIARERVDYRVEGGSVNAAQTR